MSIRLFRSATGLALAFSVGLFALPACDKKKDAANNTDTPPPEYKGSKGGPPGGPPGGTPSGTPSGTNDASLPSPPPAGPLVRVANANTRLTSNNNLRQIALAAMIFLDTKGAYPAGITDGKGKVGLSWRVAILPYLEQNELYKQFNLNEPWNSDHNRKLIAQMPKTYAPPGIETNGYTYYRSFSGKDAFLPPPGGMAQPGTPMQGIRVSEVVDGFSNTLMAAEALEPVIWTKPEDLPFTPGKPPKLGGGIFEDGFHAAFCDGSVRFLPKNIDPTTLSNLIQINDGNVVTLPK